MMRISHVSTFFALAVLSGSAGAEMCTLDVVPAATLLLPYFEADIGDDDGDGVADCTGIDTLFSINNALPATALAHVTLWTDWGFPTMDFDIFLTGFDVQSVSLCQVLGRGNLPVTADVQTDPNDTISPHHGNPEWDGSFAACAGFFPYLSPAFSNFLFNYVQNSLAGYPVTSLGGGCVGSALNGSGNCSSGSCPSGTIARGYVTVDNANQCSFLFPSDVDFGYFQDGGQGIASNVNQLWGDFAFITGPASAYTGSPLVHVEADPSFNASSTATNYTFYGRYTQGLGGIDNREPLATAWAARYVSVSPQNTDLIVWRDSTVPVSAPLPSYACGTAAGSGPDWNPLHETEVVCFDESEDLVVLCSESSDPPCFPLETQRLRLGEGNLTVPFTSGWCHLKLNIPSDSPTGDVDFPANPPGNVTQSHVASLYENGGIWSAGHVATPLASACLDSDPVGPTPIFADGFESGDLSAW